MALIVDPLPVDVLDNSLNYLTLIEHMFGKQKATDIKYKFKITGAAAPNPNAKDTVSV